MKRYNSLAATRALAVTTVAVSGAVAGMYTGDLVESQARLDLRIGMPPAVDDSGSQQQPSDVPAASSFSRQAMDLLVRMLVQHKDTWEFAVRTVIRFWWSACLTLVAYMLWSGPIYSAFDSSAPVCNVACHC